MTIFDHAKFPQCIQGDNGPLKHGGQISVEVTGKRRNKGIGLEIPATFHRKNTIVPMSMTYNKPLTERLLSLYHKD